MQFLRFLRRNPPSNPALSAQVRIRAE